MTTLSLILLLAMSFMPADGGGGRWNGALLRWTASSGADTYTVYRASAACPATPNVQVASLLLVPQYVDHNLATGSYCYAVTAVNSYGESDPSTVVGITIP
jgi:hypothetical protein